jgi:hypothetical protein
MLRSRTTDGPEGVTLEGDEAGFTLVRCVVLAGAGSIELSTAGDPSPYPRFLRHLVVEELAHGPVQFALAADGEELIVRCPPEFQEVFASNLDLSEAESGYHHHYEYFPDHHHLAADSIPVVVERI